MPLPKWAPVSLVEKLNQLHADADRYRQLDLEAKSEESNFGDFPPLSHSLDWKVAAKEADELANILHRLLVNPDMESVWEALVRRPAVNPRYQEHREYLLWDCIKRALNDFSHQIAAPLTPLQKAKSLQSVSRKAQKLLDAIVADPIAEGIANSVMATHLAIRNLEYRQDMGDTPTQAEYVIPITLEGDCAEARNKSSWKEPKGNFNKWRKQPLVSRLAYWAKEANETHLNDLLELFIESVQAAAKAPSEIKQPGRGDDAVKAFLIHRLNEFMQWCYGQPLTDSVASIVTVVLDLPSPLTRDDIRPYIPRGGRKLNKT